jgi:hypothetical protein
MTNIKMADNIKPMPMTAAIISKTKIKIKSEITDPLDMRGLIPESWHCIDCGTNTAPGMLNRAEMESAAAVLGDAWHTGASVPQHIDSDSEVYTVRDAIWAKADMGDGCLCIGCLEKRLGRVLKPRDFSYHVFNTMLGTPRLLDRRGEHIEPKC